MRTRKDAAAIVGVGAVACSACCAGPILGFLAAMGLGTVAGVALIGAAGSVITAAITAVLLARRRARRCVAAPHTVALEMPTVRTR